MKTDVPRGEVYTELRGEDKQKIRPAINGNPLKECNLPISIRLCEIRSECAQAYRAWVTRQLNRENFMTICASVIRP